MRLLLHATRCAAALLILCNTPALAGDKSVWNYQGGIFVITNGAIANGPCFRLAGRLTSGDFFDYMERIDKESRTVFRSRYENIENFHDQRTLTVVVRDLYYHSGTMRADKPLTLQFLMS